jgi:hypothetical protein
MHYTACMRRLRALLLSNFAQPAGSGWHSLKPDLSVVNDKPSGRTPGGSASQTPDRGFPHDFLKRGRSEKQSLLSPSGCMVALRRPARSLVTEEGCGLGCL